MFWFVVFEIFVIIACALAAKKMVEKRIFLANPKMRIIGGDDEQAIEKMKDIVREIIRTGKFEMTEENGCYDIQIKTKERCIENVEIRSSASKVSFHYRNGWNTENLSYTERGAIVEIAFMLWLIVFAIQIVIAIIACLIWLSALIH